MQVWEAAASRSPHLREGVPLPSGCPRCLDLILGNWGILQGDLNICRRKTQMKDHLLSTYAVCGARHFTFMISILTPTL